MKIFICCMIGMIGMILSNFVMVYLEANVYDPTYQCKKAMERKDIEEPSYFKGFWKDIAKKLEEN